MFKKISISSPSCGQKTAVRLIFNRFLAITEARIDIFEITFLISELLMYIFPYSKTNNLSTLLGLINFQEARFPPRHS